MIIDCHQVAYKRSLSTTFFFSDAVQWNMGQSSFDEHILHVLTCSKCLGLSDGARGYL